MSFTIHGVGISDGIAIGKAHLISHAFSDITHYEIEASQIDNEHERFDTAIIKAQEEITALEGQIPEGAPTEFQGFIDLHRLILNDPMLSQSPKEQITKLKCNAEWALKLQVEKLLEQFLQIKNNYLRDRKNDITQVVERVLRILIGESPKTTFKGKNENIIIVAHDISPAEVVEFKDQNVSSFITDVGGTTSHTAIIARSLNVPSIVALHNARQLIREGDVLIIDGTNGVVIISPSEDVIEEFKYRQQIAQEKWENLKKVRKKDSTTKDGVKISLLANIELPGDIDQAKQNGAEGIGLYRTEFLYLGRKNLPSEEEQFLNYKKAAIELNGDPLVIRTFDLGSDKHTEQTNHPAGPNPALGLRAIRLCLVEQQMFRDQLRAIFRASNYGNIKILIPMVSAIHEITQTLKFIEAIKSELIDQEISFNQNLAIGAMIEVPAAAIALEFFVERFDFFSVGTNDLIQYTLAIDRSDDTVTHLYNPHHPAIILLLNKIIQTGETNKKPVSICGEMAGDPRLIRLLLGLGIRSFSMHPANLLQVKDAIISSDISKITPWVNKITKGTPKDYERILDKINQI